MDSSTSAISSEQQSIAATLKYNGLANTVIADILQNLDGEAVREQIRTNP